MTKGFEFPMGKDSGGSNRCREQALEESGSTERAFLQGGWRRSQKSPYSPWLPRCPRSLWGKQVSPCDTYRVKLLVTQQDLEQALIS